MRDGRLGVGELARRMCIAVEREQASGADRLAREREIEILPRWVAVDFDGDICTLCGFEDRVPVGGETGP